MSSFKVKKGPNHRVPITQEQILDKSRPCFYIDADTRMQKCNMTLEEYVAYKVKNDNRGKFMNEEDIKRLATIEYNYATSTKYEWPKKLDGF